MQRTISPADRNTAGSRWGPSLNAMRAFEAVGRLGAVSAAASELNITPGAVSRQVKNLEAYLGAALLGRSGRGVRLTPVGERLWGELESAFAQIAETVKRARQLRSTLRLICSPILGSAWLIPRLDNFSRQMPDVDIVIHENLMHSDIKTRDADMAIVWGHFRDSDTFIAERLTEDEIFPVCSPQLRPSGDSLAGLTLIHREDVPRFWKWPDWATFLTATGIDGIDATKGGIRLTGSLALDAARQGKGFSRQHHVRSSRPHRGPSHTPRRRKNGTTCSYWLLTSRTKNDRPEVMAFRTWLLDEFADCFGNDGSVSAPPPPLPPHELGTRLMDHTAFSHRDGRRPDRPARSSPGFRGLIRPCPAPELATIRLCLLFLRGTRDQRIATEPPTVWRREYRAGCLD